MNYAFLLGREFKLSIAELFTVFPESKTVFCNKQVLILNGITCETILQKASKLGGTIKIFEADETEEKLEDLILKQAPFEGKFKYGLSTYGRTDISMRDLLLDIKKYLKKNGVSSRYTNKDNKNLSSAQILGENLVKRGTDFNYIASFKSFFGKTIWVQDIESYSARDYSKDRDMQVGMLPPKLSQMMINLSEGKSIYDPFVGLGTILIESVFMGNINVYGTDLSEQMVTTSSNNVNKLKDTFSFQAHIEKLNAKFIDESPFIDQADVIVTEGYLGEIMTQKNISKERIDKQRESLSKMYTGFFKGLQISKFEGTIVICFPFWEMRGKYFYFEEIYDILKKYCNIQPFYAEDFEHQATKSGSLLYKRDKQLVGREIFKLTIKK